MKKIIVLAVMLSGCFTGASEAKETLESQGLTEIKIGDTDFFECSNNDKAGIGFTATNSNGKRVEGVVCCGVFKRCTIRW